MELEYAYFSNLAIRQVAKEILTKELSRETQSLVGLADHDRLDLIYRKNNMHRTLIKKNLLATSILACTAFTPLSRNG